MHGSDVTRSAPPNTPEEERQQQQRIRRRRLTTHQQQVSLLNYDVNLLPRVKNKYWRPV